MSGLNISGSLYLLSEGKNLFDEALSALDTAKTEVTKVVDLLPPEAQSAISDALHLASSNVSAAASQAVSQIASGASTSTALSNVGAVATSAGTTFVTSAEHDLAAGIQSAIDAYIAARAGPAAPILEIVVSDALKFASTTANTYINGFLKGKAAQAPAG